MDGYDDVEYFGRYKTNKMESGLALAAVNPTIDNEIIR